MENRYGMTVAYADNSVKSESGNESMPLLRAAAIYWEDPECDYIHIWDRKMHNDILTFERPY